MRTTLLLLALAAAGPAGTQVLAPPTLAPVDPGAQAVIRFEGGAVADNVAKVLQVVAKAGHLATEKRALVPRQSACALYGSRMGLPGTCTSPMLALAQQLNPGVGPVQRLRPGQAVVVPAVELRTYEYRVKYDRYERNDAEQIAQRARSSDPYMVKQEANRDGTTRFVYRGFELKVPVASDAELDALMERLGGLQSQNVIMSATRQAKRNYKLYAFEEPRRYFQGCAQGASSQGSQGHLALLMGTRPAQCRVACTAGSDCPEVILIDTPVDAHPDLNSALLPVVAPLPAPPASCHTTPFDEARHHGTHLAGIIAAGDNGFGIVGVNPAALVVPVLRTTPDHELADWIARRDDGAGFPIYAFASNWEGGDALENDNARFFRYAIARAIRNVRPLWITAAGDEGREVRTVWPRGPMNLGDQPNVVVVTACDDCGSRPTLLKPSNWSSSLVHLAAPGKDIPSTVGSGEYAVASGTSQATAFVAGVASAMQACFPGYYTRPHRIKSRLQVTSRPFPGELPEQERADARLAAGVLDPTVALLDPTGDWIKLEGADHTSQPLRQWLQDKVAILDPVTRKDVAGSPVSTRAIYRIVEVPGPDGDARRHFVVFAKLDDQQGAVVRIGPGLIADETKPLVETCAGRKLNLSEMEDLLLSFPITNPRPCQ